MGPGVSTHRQAAGEGRQMAACEEQEDIGLRHSRPFRSLEHCSVVIQSAEPLSYPRLDHLGRKSGPGFGGRQPGRATLMPLCLLSLLIFLFTLFFVCRRARCRGQRSTYESPFSPSTSWSQGPDSWSGWQQALSAAQPPRWPSYLTLPPRLSFLCFFLFARF